jgi:hypothetical protein
LQKDPKLTTERGQALRLLLRLFEQDKVFRALRSGLGEEVGDDGLHRLAFAVPRVTIRLAAKNYAW